MRKLSYWRWWIGWKLRRKATKTMNPSPTTPLHKRIWRTTLTSCSCSLIKMIEPATSGRTLLKRFTARRWWVWNFDVLTRISDSRILSDLRHHPNLRWAQRGSSSEPKIRQVEGRVHSQLLEEWRDPACGSDANWRRGWTARHRSWWRSRSGTRWRMEHKPVRPAASSVPASSAVPASTTNSLRSAGASKQLQPSLPLAGPSQRSRAEASRRLHSVQPARVKSAIVWIVAPRLRTHARTNRKSAEVHQICWQCFDLWRRSDSDREPAEVPEVAANRTRLLSSKIFMFLLKLFSLRNK